MHIGQYETKVTVVAFSYFEEGLMVAVGNPRSVSSVADLARNDARIVNRDPGLRLTDWILFSSKPSGANWSFQVTSWITGWLRAVLDVLQTRSFRSEPASLPGYESTRTGTVISTG